MKNKGVTVVTAQRAGGTYYFSLKIKMPIEEALTATLQQSHSRLNHLPEDLVLKMINSNAVRGLKVANNFTHDCPDCKLNKCQRVSHRASSSPKATKTAQVIHADIIGPINPSGYNGERFILCCRDEFSAFRFIICLKRKGQTPEAMKEFLNQDEMITGHECARLVSDNGSEFLSERLKSFLQFKGIEHRPSAPYVPQQNGLAERENRSLLTQARTILNASKLPTTLWPFAVEAATYVSNHCLKKDSDTTPCQ